MKTYLRFKQLSISIFLLGVSLTACLSDAKEEINDTQNELNENQSVKNLKVSYKSFGIDSLVEPEDPQALPENYKLFISLQLKVENPENSDAQSQGLETELELEGVSEPSIKLPFEPFEVPAQKEQIEKATTVLDFKNNKESVKYILSQYVNEEELRTKIGINLLFEIVGNENTLELPKLSQDIPTQGQLPESTKNKMSKVLESGILD